ncbi:histidine kinase [Kitasatospora sp. NPDC004799]|uniref:sensor histidine kinase n=1 Tax=Kitasatospora sp. NPDC004799 TaxID=3154460 RepID=UPI0033B4E593
MVRAGRGAWVRSTRLQDAALSLAVVVPEVFYFGPPLDPGVTWSDLLLLFAFAVPEAVALAFRRRWPVGVFAVLWVCAVLGAALALTTHFVFNPYFGLLLGLYTVARECRTPAALAALALALVPAGLDTWLVVVRYGTDGHLTSAIALALAFYLPLTAFAWGVGLWSRASAAAAEHDRRELARAREAVAYERTRIARELHDIVANAVAVIVLQAETARATTADDRAGTVDALTHIEGLGRGAMAELRRMLRLLRTADASTDEFGRHGLADLAPLLEEVRRAGIEVDLEVRGTPVHLDESVDLTAYRLVQEAITNVTKHAGAGSRATVRITWADALHVEVVDDGAGRRPEDRRELSTGHGLIGLAERIALFGGELTASPYRSGFRVAATLPLPDPHAPTVTPLG